MGLFTNTTVKEKASIFISATREDVWNILTDFSTWPDWNDDVTKMSYQGKLVVGEKFIWNSGGLQIVSTLEVIDTLNKIVWSGKTIGTNAHHVYSLTVKDGGVLVETEESFVGWLPSLFPNRMKIVLKKALETGLVKLKKRVESKLG